MKLTIAWNVWNNYQDTALGSEIFRLENNEKKIFDEVHLISQGGYPEPPTKGEMQYLDGHFFVQYPDVPLLQAHPKYRGIFRIIEGVQKAFQYAQERGHDYVVVTNADAWFLSIEKLAALLYSDSVRSAAVSMRMGWLTGLEINFGNRVPLGDDHFMIFNVSECKKCGVFEYDHSARFFSSHFGHFGGMHYLLMNFVNQRVPLGKFCIYSSLEDAVNHFGDSMGWNLLPWQYQPSLGFLHANCAHIDSLHRLRAAFLHDLGFTKYPTVKRYYNEIAPNQNLFTRRNGLLVYKKPLERALIESLYWSAFRVSALLARKRYERFYAALPDNNVYKKTLYYFDKFKYIKPTRLTQ